MKGMYDDEWDCCLYFLCCHADLSDGDDDYAYPIEVSESILDDQFPSEYELEVNESRTGTLVFEAPEGTKDFGVGFIEYYENDTEGNGFWVYFTADEK